MKKAKNSSRNSRSISPVVIPSESPDESRDLNNILLDDPPAAMQQLRAGISLRRLAARNDNLRICPNCGFLTLKGMPGGVDATCQNCGYKDPCCSD